MAKETEQEQTPEEAAETLTAAEIENLIGLVDRAPITGKEAATVAMLKQKLGRIGNRLVLAAMEPEGSA